jgi:hypothetical protein
MPREVGPLCLGFILRKASTSWPLRPSNVSSLGRSPFLENRSSSADTAFDQDSAISYWPKPLARAFDRCDRRPAASTTPKPLLKVSLLCGITKLIGCGATVASPSSLLDASRSLRIQMSFFVALLRPVETSTFDTGPPLRETFRFLVLQ